MPDLLSCVYSVMDNSWTSKDGGIGVVAQSFNEPKSTLFLINTQDNNGILYKKLTVTPNTVYNWSVLHETFKADNGAITPGGISFGKTVGTSEYGNQEMNNEVLTQYNGTFTTASVGTDLYVKIYNVGTTKGLRSCFDRIHIWS